MRPGTTDSEGRKLADSIEQSGTEQRPVFKGRATVYSRFDEIDESNVLAALDECLPFFAANVAQISYLWRYYKGVQPILSREKKVREDIKNTVVENHAQEVVAFKLGYQLAEPLQYTCRMQEPKAGGESEAGEGESVYDATLAQVNELNTLMFAEDKASCDRDLFEWMCVCGIGFRMCEADSAEDAEDGGAPFEIHTLDPRETFVARSRSYHHRVVMSVWVGVDSDDEKLYNVYTGKMWFLVKNQKIVDKRPITYGANPIVEYQLNNARMGVFEPVLGLLDAINLIESNRLDDIEQTVQALMKFINCEVDKDEFLEMLDLGAVKVRTIDPNFKSDIQMLTTDLDQTGAQTAKDDLYQSVVNICGMPNRNGQGGSTSDTGAAVLLRDGWTLAESHAKSYELQFKRFERDFLRVALAICRQSAGCEIDLRIRDIELAFNRRNYENILIKSQVLTTMLASGKIHPLLAFQSCGMFTDPDAAYRLSQEYAAERGTGLAEAALAVASDQALGETVNAGSQAAVPEPGEGDSAIAA